MKQEFRVVVESPYGKQPISEFRHWMNKVADDALTRWGISISVEAIESDGSATELPEGIDDPDGFNTSTGEQ